MQGQEKLVKVGWYEIEYWQQYAMSDGEIGEDIVQTFACWTGNRWFDKTGRLIFEKDIVTIGDAVSASKI